ncbi:MAG: glycosyltransferase family 4 protein, partial [Pseudomonadota bacterium]
MKIAYYAPMKPIDHPTPSGDRRMARAFFQLLQDLGHDVYPISKFRSYEGAGSAANQARVRQQAEKERHHILAAIQDSEQTPNLWFTYHAYHKSPDWLGPEVCNVLGIPYVVAEASFAEKQRNGRWQLGHERMVHTVNTADQLLAMTRVDAEGLQRIVRFDTVRSFPPFIGKARYAESTGRQTLRQELVHRYKLDTAVPWILTVAMMRDDVKFQSYGLMIETLALLKDEEWHWLIVGDGDRRFDIEGQCRQRLDDRFTMLGPACSERLGHFYMAADMFGWPALKEAYGMVLLEAQSFGLPVIAGRQGGVEDVLVDQETGMLVNATKNELAEGIGLLLRDPRRRTRLGNAAAYRIHRHHDIAVAKARMKIALQAAFQSRG